MEFSIECRKAVPAEIAAARKLLWAVPVPEGGRHFVAFLAHKVAVAVPGAGGSVNGHVHVHIHTYMCKSMVIYIYIHLHANHVGRICISLVRIIYDYLM